MIENDSYKLNFCGPLTISWDLTNRCNLNCRHCFNRSGDYPKSGEIKIDNNCINNYDYTSYKKNVLYVSTKFNFISGTLMDNLCLYNQYDDCLVESICKLCGLSSVIQNLPNGLHTKIKSIVGDFSDGEMRKITLARAFLRNSKILCLDEPTSFLDSKSAKEICEIIANYKTTYKCTIIIASHDENVAEIADHFIDL